jgi:hypothetical protein
MLFAAFVSKDDVSSVVCQTVNAWSGIWEGSEMFWDSKCYAWCIWVGWPSILLCLLGISWQGMEK